MSLTIRDRVKEFRRVRAGDLLPHPLNWRTHPPEQLAAIRGALQEVGFAGAVLVRELPGGGYGLIDGHARTEVMAAGGADAEAMVPVLVLDVTEDEANKLLASYDPIGDMAGASAKTLESLLADLQVASADVGKVLTDTLAEAVNPFRVTQARVQDLRPHPRNYQAHPQDQLDHLKASITHHGYYRNVIVARGGVILAGHGVVAASRQLGRAFIPVVQLDLDADDPRALKVLISDNEIRNLAETDDRALTDMLRGLLQLDPSQGGGLPGTGFDGAQLAAMVLNTRPESEVQDINEAAEWVGMPGYDPGDNSKDYKLSVVFRSEADRERFVSEKALRIDKREGTWITRWPWTEREDGGAIRFKGSEGQP